MTEDLEVYGEFYLDKEINQHVYQNALESKEFAIELSASSILYDILSMHDCFGSNTSNYGILQDGNKFYIKFGNKFYIKFVDHLPNSNYGLFSSSQVNKDANSPRLRLQKKSSIHELMSNLACLE